MLSFSRLVADLYCGGRHPLQRRHARPDGHRGLARRGRPRRPAGRAGGGAREGRARAGRSDASPTPDEVAAVIVFLCSERASLRDRRRLERRRRHRPDHHLTAPRLPCNRMPELAGRVGDAFAARIRALEERALSPLAVRSYETRGRPTPEDECLVRTPFQRDRDRIVHSKPFRRLKGKTQVFIDPARRPLPHAHDPHARDDRDRARRCACAAV